MAQNKHESMFKFSAVCSIVNTLTSSDYLFSYLDSDDNGYDIIWTFFQLIMITKQPNSIEYIIIIYLYSQYTGISPELS